jgi:hypothetical protein
VTGASAVLLMSLGLYAHGMGTSAPLAFVPDLTEIAGLAGPLAFVSLATLIAPLLPRSARFSMAGQDDTRLAFSAIRVSRHDDFWTADSALGSAGKMKRAADYPFAQTCAHRLTCWRGMLLNSGADPILDITVANRCTEAFLVAAIGIEIIGVGCAPERRGALGARTSAQVAPRDGYAVQTPSALALFERAHQANGNRDFFAMDVSLEEATDLSEPFYLRPTKSFRFELRLLDFCENVPLHAMARLVLQTDSGTFRSPAIYFRR